MFLVSLYKHKVQIQSTPYLESCLAARIMVRRAQIGLIPVPSIQFWLE
jgi:hypothetical protein